MKKNNFGSYHSIEGEALNSSSPMAKDKEEEA